MCFFYTEKSVLVRNQNGFSLLEVMIAMVILGIGIMAIVVLQVSDMNYNSGSKRQSEGYNWAMDRVEQLYTLDYAAPDLAISNSSVNIVGDGHLDTDPVNQSTPGDGIYSLEWDVSTNPNVQNSRIVNVFIRRNNREIARLDFTRIQDM